MLRCVEVSVDPLEQVMRERAREGASRGRESTCLSLSSLSRLSTLSPGLGIDEWEDWGAQDCPGLLAATSQPSTPHCRQPPPSLAAPQSAVRGGQPGRQHSVSTHTPPRTSYLMPHTSYLIPHTLTPLQEQQCWFCVLLLQIRS